MGKSVCKFLTAICGLSDKSLYSFALVYNFVFPFQPKVWRTAAFFNLDLEWQADSGSVQLPVSFPQSLSGAPQAWDNPRYRGAYSAQNGKWLFSHERKLSTRH